MTFKSTMGTLSVLFALIAYSNYIRQSARTQGIEPHPFSWFLWTGTTGVAFALQVTHNGGAGSWSIGVTAVACLFIATLSFMRNKVEFSTQAWVALVAGIVALICYAIWRNTTTWAFWATGVDVFAYLPTIDKGWGHPEKDSIVSFFLNALKFLSSFFALGSLSLATGLYPATLVVFNAAVVALLLSRRQRLGFPLWSP